MSHFEVLGLMDATYARQILKRPSASSASGELLNGIYKGLNLVVEKVGIENDLRLATDDYRIWMGLPFDKIVHRMDPDEIAQMGRWGWFHDEGCWAHNV